MGVTQIKGVVSTSHKAHDIVPLINSLLAWQSWDPTIHPSHYGTDAIVRVVKKVFICIILMCWYILFSFIIQLFPRPCSRVIWRSGKADCCTGGRKYVVCYDRLTTFNSQRDSLLVDPPQQRYYGVCQSANLRMNTIPASTTSEIKILRLIRVVKVPAGQPIYEWIPSQLLLIRKLRFLA